MCDIDAIVSVRHPATGGRCLMSSEQSIVYELKRFAATSHGGNSDRWDGPMRCRRLCYLTRLFAASTTQYDNRMRMIDRN